MLSNQSTLHDLQTNFRETSSSSMPIAGMTVWAALGVTALFVSKELTANLALYIMVGILPLAFLLDLARGKNLFAGGTKNPLTQLFLTSIFGIALMVPIAVTGAQTGDPTTLVLGMAILAGVIWIPYGWAAADPVGLRHALARGVGSYVAFYSVPDPYKASAICAVVVVAYLYSLAFMRR